MQRAASLGYEGAAAKSYTLNPTSSPGTNCPSRDRLGDILEYAT